MRAAPLTSRLLLVGLVLVITAILIDGSLRTPKPKKPEAKVPEADVPLLHTPDWLRGDTLRSLLLRSGSEGQGVLLLKLREREAVYRYDPHTQALTLVSVEHWHNAQGPIKDCKFQQFAPSPLVLSSAPKGQLHAGQRRIATAGTTTLNRKESTSGKYAAVLSATGPRRESLLPFLGRGGIAGPHYHQVFSLPEAVPLGKPVRLPLETDKGSIMSCWSPDDQYVVYSDLVYSLAIVSVAGQP